MTCVDGRRAGRLRETAGEGAARRGFAGRECVSWQVGAGVSAGDMASRPRRLEGGGGLEAAGGPPPRGGANHAAPPRHDPRHGAHDASGGVGGRRGLGAQHEQLLDYQRGRAAQRGLGGGLSPGQALCGPDHEKIRTHTAGLARRHARCWTGQAWCGPGASEMALRHMGGPKACAAAGFGRAGGRRRMGERRGGAAAGWGGR